MKKNFFLLGLLIIYFSVQPSFADISEEEYKCGLMIKGYEFSNDGLSEAIIKNDKEAIELFVKADININLPDNEGYSALDRALKIKDKEAVLILCKAGGETKITDIPEEFVKIINQEENNIISEKSVVISDASKNTEIETVKDKQINTEQQTYSSEEQFNKLCELINSNRIEDVAKLLKNTNNLNLLSEEGLAPIHYAVFNDNPAMVHLLLSSGSKVNKETNDGLTPLDIAILNNQKVVARVIMEYGGSISGQVAKELLKFGCPVNYNEETNLYDASIENIFSTMVKIQQKLNGQND